MFYYLVGVLEIAYKKNINFTGILTFVLFKIDLGTFYKLRYLIIRRYLR